MPPPNHPFWLRPGAIIRPRRPGASEGRVTSVHETWADLILLDGESIGAAPVNINILQRDWEFVRWNDDPVETQSPVEEGRAVLPRPAPTTPSNMGQALAVGVEIFLRWDDQVRMCRIEGINAGWVEFVTNVGERITAPRSDVEPNIVGFRMGAGDLSSLMPTATWVNPEPPPSTTALNRWLNPARLTGDELALANILPGQYWGWRDPPALIRIAVTDRYAQVTSFDQVGPGHEGEMSFRELYWSANRLAVRSVLVPEGEGRAAGDVLRLPDGTHVYVSEVRMTDPGVDGLDTMVVYSTRNVTQEQLRGATLVANHTRPIDPLIRLLAEQGVTPQMQSAEWPESGEFWAWSNPPRMFEVLTDVGADAQHHPNPQVSIRWSDGRVETTLISAILQNGTRLHPRIPLQAHDFPNFRSGETRRLPSGRLFYVILDNDVAYCRFSGEDIAITDELLEQMGDSLVVLEPRPPEQTTDSEVNVGDEWQMRGYVGAWTVERVTDTTVWMAQRRGDNNAGTAARPWERRLLPTMGHRIVEAQPGTVIPGAVWRHQTTGQNWQIENVWDTPRTVLLRSMMQPDAERPTVQIIDLVYDYEFVSAVPRTVREGATIFERLLEDDA